MKQKKVIEVRRSLLSEIRASAKDKGITQLEISERTGFSPNSVSRMLSGSYPPTLDSLIKLCDAVGLSVAVKRDAVGKL